MPLAPSAVSSSAQEVSLNRHQLMSILHQMRDGLLVFDESGVIISANQAFERALSHNQASLMGLSLYTIFETSAPELAHALMTGIKSKEPFDGDVAIAGVLGQMRFYVYHAMPIIPDTAAEPDKQPDWAVIFNDVTDIKQTEKMRRDFVANVSHELRTPLSAIHGYAETLLEGALDDQLVSREFVNIMFNHSSRLSRLVQDLLDLSKLESNAPSELMPLSLPTLVQKVVGMSQKAVQTKSLTLTVTIDTNITQVWADEDTLEQVLTNLVDNAIKYTPALGRIGITVTETNAVAGHVIPGEERWIQVDIADTGMGIESKHIPRLFERFYRVDKARSRDLGGTGLGLSIVKHIIQNHGGDVWVNSVPGQGSTFSFTLRPVTDV